MHYIFKFSTRLLLLIFHFYHIQDVSNTHRDAIFYQAALSKEVWDLATEVMNLFEKAKLKGQKLNLSTLLTKPEFKQQYLAPIRRLQPPDQTSLLQKVISGECSLSELKEAATEIKQMSALRAAFVRLVNVESWEEAQEKFPLFATTEELRKFRKIDLNKCVPQSFADFCTRAKLSTGQSQDGNGLQIKLGNVEGYILKGKITELSGQQIKSVFSSFRGANLTIASLPEVI